MKSMGKNEVDDRNDDAQLEAYLRSFRPRPPAPLPTAMRTSGRERGWAMAMLSTAALVLIALLLQKPGMEPVARQAPELKPFTFGMASRRLVEERSWRAVIDDAGFRFPIAGAKTMPGPSALEILSREEPLK